MWNKRDFFQPQAQGLVVDGRHDLHGHQRVTEQHAGQAEAVDVPFPQGKRGVKYLRAALEILPVDALLIGWDLPPALVDVCRDETRRFGVKLIRWQPALRMA